MGERQKSKMQGLIHLVLQPGSRRHPSAAGDPEIAEKAARKTALVAEHCLWHEANLQTGYSFCGIGYVEGRCLQSDAEEGRFDPLGRRGGRAAQPGRVALGTPQKESSLLPLILS